MRAAWRVSLQASAADALAGISLAGEYGWPFIYRQSIIDIACQRSLPNREYSPVSRPKPSVKATYLSARRLAGRRLSQYTISLGNTISPLMIADASHTMRHALLIDGATPGGQVTSQAGGMIGRRRANEATGGDSRANRHRAAQPAANEAETVSSHLRGDIAAR